MENRLAGIATLFASRLIVGKSRGPRAEAGLGGASEPKRNRKGREKEDKRKRKGREREEKRKRKGREREEKRKRKGREKEEKRKRKRREKEEKKKRREREKEEKGKRKGREKEGLMRDFSATKYSPAGRWGCQFAALQELSGTWAGAGGGGRDREPPGSPFPARRNELVYWFVPCPVPGRRVR